MPRGLPRGSLPNNLTGAPSSVCELYRCRWSIETFFREIKQTLNLCDFLGHSANAVRWQVWTALLLYVLMRFQAYLDLIRKATDLPQRGAKGARKT